jgi:hypothetical protein
MEAFFWAGLLVVMSAIITVRMVNGILKVLLNITVVVGTLFIICFLVYGTVDTFMARVNGEWGRIVESSSPQFRSIVLWITDRVENAISFFKEIL